MKNVATGKSLRCGDRFSIPGFAAVIAEARKRRFPVVDEERGLVYDAILKEPHFKSSIWR